jgi:hypothetical protein
VRLPDQIVEASCSAGVAILTGAICVDWVGC